MARLSFVEANHYLALMCLIIFGISQASILSSFCYMEALPASFTEELQKELNIHQQIFPFEGIEDDWILHNVLGQYV